MTISFFLQNNLFYVHSEQYSKIYEVAKMRKMADSIALFLKDVALNANFSHYKRIVYSSGATSFTTARIIYSLLKGLRIAFPALTFLGISHFLTYLTIFNKKSPSGIIAISTMRGDYFICEYNQSLLSSVKILSIDTLKRSTQIVFFIENSDFNNLNLAKLQFQLLNTPALTRNLNFINNDLKIDYGFTPEYKNQNTCGF